VTTDKEFKYFNPKSSKKYDWIGDLRSGMRKKILPNPDPQACFLVESYLAIGKKGFGSRSDVKNLTKTILEANNLTTY
jgi:hypothetical protein